MGKMTGAVALVVGNAPKAAVDAHAAGSASAAASPTEGSSAAELSLIARRLRWTATSTGWRRATSTSTRQSMAEAEVQSNGQVG